MALDFHSFSKTAGSNTLANTGINFNENQNPSTVNNAARDLMAYLKAMLLDIAGQTTVGGTADAITITANAGFSALASGKFVAFKAGGTNTGAATANVNTIGVKKIRRQGDTALSAGDIVSGGIYLLIYDEAYDSAAGAWVLFNGERRNLISLSTGDVSTTAVVTEETLKSYAIPAGTLKAGMRVRIRAWGVTAANGNTKTLRMRFGGGTALIAASAAYNNLAWILEAEVEITGTDTQAYVGTSTIFGLTSGAFNGNKTEDDGSAITCSVTGQNGTANAGDITCRAFRVEVIL